MQRPELVKWQGYGQWNRQNLLAGESRLLLLNRGQEIQIQATRQGSRWLLGDGGAVSGRCRPLASLVLRELVKDVFFPVQSLHFYS